MLPSSAAGRRRGRMKRTRPTASGIPCKSNEETQLGCKRPLPPSLSSSSSSHLVVRSTPSTPAPGEEDSQKKPNEEVFTAFLHQELGRWVKQREAYRRHRSSNGDDDRAGVDLEEQILLKDYTNMLQALASMRPQLFQALKQLYGQVCPPAPLINSWVSLVPPFFHYDLLLCM